MVKNSEKVLEAWKHLEYLNPYIITPNKNLNIYSRSDRLPWENNYKGAYIIYLGVFYIQEVYSIIQEAIPVTLNEKMELNLEKEISNSDNKSCFASIEVDGNGRYISDSLELSLMPFKLSCFSKSKDEDFKKYKDSVSIYVNKRLDRIVSYQSIQDVSNKILEICNININLEDNLFIEKVRVNNKGEIIAKNSIINSFYIDDIEKVIYESERNNIGNALKNYLEGKEGTKIDIGENIQEIKKILSPDKIPMARWPENSLYHLSLMQSVSVNLALDLKGDIFSVNGPPGTGKTTLLKDIIANLIYERANLLADYKNPKNVFSKEGLISVNGYNYSVYNIPEKISEYSILITSSNNGAVENISKELPKKSKGLDGYLKDSEDIYFSEIGKDLLGEDAWGIFSVALGNSKNRKEFFKKLWFDRPRKMVSYLEQEPKISWSNAVKEFKSKEKEVGEELASIKILSTILEKIDDLELEKVSKEEELDLIVSKQKENEHQISQLSGAIELLKKGIEENEYLLKRLKDTKPKSIFYFFNRKYRAQKIRIKNEIKRIKREIHENNSLVIEFEYESLQLDHRLKKVSKNIKEIKFEVENEKKRIAQKRHSIDGNFPDREYWNQDNSNLQKTSPWMYKKLNKLRAELFIESIKLHKNFILNNRDIFKKSIIPSFINLLNNSIEKKDSHLYGELIINNFFLLVPVLSTTFASVQNMLKYIGKESIGWLFVDEAGQAIPQAAVGAIWRSKNAVIVGDPIQIEPIVQISDILITRLREHFNLDSMYLSKESSVQTIADNSNLYGSYIENKWVGCPLKVHRRCIDPMFSISNQIAYDNAMVCATLKPKSQDKILEGSYWFDMKGKLESTHYIKEQGEIIKKILETKFFDNNEPEVFIISPFKDVVNKLNECLKTYPESWRKKSIGTIHTFQGKEEKAVILCLGLDETKEKAADWASKSPNILNVAVTRAKYELILIGDLELWEKRKYFNVASENLKILKNDDIKKFLFKEENNGCD